MKYSINLQIDKLHLIGYTESINRKRKYIFKCSCGQKIEATTTSIERMYKTLNDYGHVGCMVCIRKTKVLNRLALGGEYYDIYNRYKKGAKNRKIFWDLSYTVARNLFTKPCTYCGNIPNKTFSKSKYHKIPYNGIDRVDSLEGYVLTNVVSCCKQCNMAKGEMSVTEFLLHIKQIYDFQRLEQRLVDPSGSKQEGSN